MIRSKNAAITELNERSGAIFRQIVEGYVKTGGPVGSRTLAKQAGLDLSPASIRNVMADLEEAGLLYSPHTSAGRLPTEAGLRLFVDGLLEMGDPKAEERSLIDTQCAAAGKNVEEVLNEATSALSGLSHCAGLVVAPKLESALKHIEFVSIGEGKALVVIVTDNGLVENRVIDVPPGLPVSNLVEAGNYLNHRLRGLTLEEARALIEGERETQQKELDALTARVVEAGVASWAGGGRKDGTLIVRGQSHLLHDVTAVEELDHIRALFEALETKAQLMRLLDSVNKAEGVQIFIGAESDLFDLSGCSMIVSPYHNGNEQIIGAIGVIGPTRINYARIIPLVDYTAKVVGRMIG